MLVLRGVVVALILLILWQVVVWIFNLPPYILPGPMLVLKSLTLNAGLIVQNALPTLIETVLGLVLGIITGALFAILMYMFAWLGLWFLPIMLISQAIPSFAIAPILVTWFGYGLTSKIITIIIMLFFPVASALYYGLKSTPDEWLDVAKTMAGSRYRILWYVQLPAAFPQFANGIRIATTLAPIGAIISEWMGASQGLGFLMLNANARLEIDLMFACLLTLMAITLTLYGLVSLILRSYPQTSA